MFLTNLWNSESREKFSVVYVVTKIKKKKGGGYSSSVDYIGVKNS